MKFSKKVSKQPRKQRKALYEAPLHARRKLLHAHLSRELRKSLGRRSALVAKGDSVKIIRGKYRGASGKVVKVDLKRGFVGVENVLVKKQGGKESPARLKPASFVITDVGQRKIRPGGKKAAAQNNQNTSVMTPEA